VLQAQTAQKPNKDMQGFLQQLSATRKTIADSYVHWTDAMKSKQVDALVSMYTDDATILPDEKAAVSGKDAIRKFYGEWLAEQSQIKDQKFEDINSIQEDDLLIDSTKYSEILVRDGKEISYTGKRLIVWKRQFQGPWKILRDIWNKSVVSN
jgi:ketosteroid isomerase-like protein